MLPADQPVPLTYPTCGAVLARHLPTAAFQCLLSLLATPSLAEEVHPYLNSTASPMGQQFARVTLLSDHRVAVGRLALPTLVVQCADEVAGLPEVDTYLLRHLPCAYLVTLATAGHWPLLSAPHDLRT